VQTRASPFSEELDGRAVFAMPVRKLHDTETIEAGHRNRGAENYFGRHCPAALAARHGSQREACELRPSLQAGEGREDFNFRERAAFELILRSWIYLFDLAYNFMLRRKRGYPASWPKAETHVQSRWHGAAVILGEAAPMTL
jgi:hypothetical protein